MKTKSVIVCAGLAALAGLGFYEFQSPKIFLYGEAHSDSDNLDQEFALWATFYRKGMRHLFVELPYYEAEFLNLWMKAEDDALLDALNQDTQGTASTSEASTRFYQKIKKECPETVFHGTDVGHQYDSAGARFLAFLEEHGQKGSEVYRLALENIEQGKRFHATEHSDWVYREQKMVENFVRAFETLRQTHRQAIMGIYGSAHVLQETGIESVDWKVSVPNMFEQLRKKYGRTLRGKDLTKIQVPFRTDKVIINDKEYEAEFFGTDLWTPRPNVSFWRVKDAYADFKKSPKTGDVLPFYCYPMEVKKRQVFIFEKTHEDGSVERRFFRSDGNVLKNSSITEEFILEKR